MYTSTPVIRTTEHGDLLVRRVRLSAEDTGEPAPTYLHLVAWTGAPDNWINALELDAPDEERIAQMIDTPEGRHMLTRMAVIAGSSWQVFEADPISFLDHNQSLVDALGSEGIAELMGKDISEIFQARLLMDMETPQPADPILVAV